MNWTEFQQALWALFAHLRSPARKGMTAVITTDHHGHATEPVALPWHCMAAV